MKTTKNGKKVNITKAGYLYVDGKKMSERKITPFDHLIDCIDDEYVLDYARTWTNKNYKMVNG